MELEQIAPNPTSHQKLSGNKKAKRKANCPPNVPQVRLTVVDVSLFRGFLDGVRWRGNLREYI